VPLAGGEGLLAGRETEGQGSPGFSQQSLLQNPAVVETKASPK